MNDYDFKKLVKLEPDQDYYKVCPECDGYGECEYEVAVPAPMAWRGGWLEDRLLTCQKCEGHGEVELDYDKDCMADEYGNLYMKDDPRF